MAPLAGFGEANKATRLWRRRKDGEGRVRGPPFGDPYLDWRGAFVVGIAVSTLGRTRLTIAIPADLGLLGVTIFTQAVVWHGVELETGRLTNVMGDRVSR